jgi:hypothetical protein
MTIMQKQHWSDQVRAGDFSAIPIPFTWNQSAEFAHLINCYELTGSAEACARIRRRVLAEIRSTGLSTASPLEIWVALFFEHRAYRHSGYGPGDEERVCLDLLCERLRVQLLSLTPDQRAGILGAMTEATNRVVG